MMLAANWPFSDTTTTMSDRIHRWTTKHPLKLVVHLNSLRALRAMCLPKKTIQEYEMQTRKLSL